MKRLILICIFLQSVLVAYTQHPPDTVNGKLLALDQPKRVINKYVNFDVFKFIMIGHGRGTGSLRNGAGLSISGQFLFPYAFLKDAGIPIAWGIHFGSSKITMPGSRVT